VEFGAAGKARIVIGYIVFALGAAVAAVTLALWAKQRHATRGGRRRR
jgi:hypothetical protein